MSSGASTGSRRPLTAASNRRDQVSGTAAGLGSTSQCRAVICFARQTHEAVAAFQSVIEEGEFMIARERREPQRQLGKIDGARILVDTIEAALRDEAAGVQSSSSSAGMIGRVSGQRTQASTSRIADRAAGFDQEGARAHRRIADFEIEHLLGRRVRRRGARRRVPAHSARSARSGCAACSGCRCGGARRSAAEAACPRARLAARRAALVDDRSSAAASTSADVSPPRSPWRPSAESWPRPASSFRYLMRSLPFMATSFVKIDENRRAVVLAGLDGERPGPAAASTVKPITVS